MREFDYVSPKSLTAALRAIKEGRGNYKLLAGGTNLLPNLREGGVKPTLLIDLGNIRALRHITEKNGKIRIGALTSISDLLNSSLVKGHAPVLWHAASNFAGPVVRNRATVGGNLVDASPAADTAVPLLALRAQVKLRSAEGQRTVALEEFFAGYRKTRLSAGEILTEISFPIPTRGTKQAYCKLGRRNAMAISVASVGFVMSMKGKTCEVATIALGAVAPTPMRAREAETVLRGKKVDLGLARECGEFAATETSPVDDIRASASYRRQMCEVLVRRLICESLGLGE